jgi:hypothetical protein
VPIVLAGEPVEAVAAEHLVRIFHRDVLVAEHVQRRKPDPRRPAGDSTAVGQPAAAPPTDGLTVTRMVDSSGYVSFAGTNYRSGTAGAAAGPRSASLPVRRSFPVTATSCASTRSGTTGPKSTRSPPRTRGPPPAGCAGRGRRQGHAAARSAYRPSLDSDPLTRRSKAAARNHPTRKPMLIMSSRYRN